MGTVATRRNWEPGLIAEAFAGAEGDIDRTVGDLTLAEVMRRNADLRGALPALKWKSGEAWESLTWSAYRERTLEVAAGLLSLGVEPGDVVAIQGSNRPEHVVADLATIHAGGTGVTLYGTLASPQIAYIGGDCQAKVAVLEDETYLERWQAIRPELPRLRHIVLMQGASSEDVISWTDLVRRGRELLAQSPSLVEERISQLRPTDTATMIYTSGTTGFPKGVVFTHRNLLWTTEAVRRTLDLPDNLRLVSYLPLAHIAERMSTHYLGMWLGCEVFYCPDVRQVLDYTLVARPQAFLGVPRIWEKLQARLQARFAEDRRRGLIMFALENGKKVVRARQGGRRPLIAGLLNALFDRLVFRKVRQGLGLDEVSVAVTTAAPTDPDLVVFFNALGIPLCELYGLSECSGPATTNRPGANRIGSVGRPLAGVEITLGPDGEVLVRGGNVVSGYHNLAHETEESFDSEGWLRTGDLGSIDAEGFVWITGRKKDLIITAGGKNIAPAPLEVALKSHPLVAHCCVVGDSLPFLTVLVALDSEEAAQWAHAHNLAWDDLAGFVRVPEVVDEIRKAVDDLNKRLSRVEQIKKFSLVPDEWSPESGEVTPSLKVKRGFVLKRYDEAIRQMYEG
jgi:long-chain acyl-CoA synthetase